jgi:hypothetical protein
MMGIPHLPKPGRYPDFLYAAVERTACAPFFEERRIKFREPTKLHRKSGTPRFPVRSCGKDRVCAFLQGKAHEVQGTHETTQEIADMGHPSFVRGRERVGSELSK